MARKRQIDPGIWTSEQFINLHDPWTRLLFIGIFSNADDEGRLKASPAYLKTIIFPGDNVDVEEVKRWRDTITEQGLIHIYNNGQDPTEYLFLPNWSTYQYISKPYPSKLPTPPFPNHSRTIPEPSRSLGIGNGIGNGIGKGRNKVAPDHRIKEILETIERKLHQQIPFYAKEGAAIKRALAMGFTPEEILGCWEMMRGFDFWQGKWLPLAKVTENLGEYKSGRLRDGAKKTRRVTGGRQATDFEQGF